MFDFQMFFPETMEIFTEDLSIEEFDIDFEFDAPRFYHFSKPELDSETEETELWFESSGNYSPSAFSLNLSLRYDEKHLEIPKPISDKQNGFIHVPNLMHKSKTKTILRKNSTLMRPTAALLARQNKPLDAYSVRLLTRCQRSLANDKLSSVLCSMPQTQDTKRQKLETGFLRKVSRLDQTPFVHKVPKKGTKVTVPKEPNLKTAQRAARQRLFKANSAPEQIAKFSSTMNKTCSQDFKGCNLRTSLRAKERSSTVKLKLAKDAPTTDPTNTLTSKSVGSRKVMKLKVPRSSKSNSQLFESKICPLDSKLPRGVSHSYCSSLKESKVLKETSFRDEPFIESLSKLCLTSEADSVAILLD